MIRANTVTFNGRLYDSRTGQPLDSHSSLRPHQPSTPQKPRVIDGITRKAASATPSVVRPTAIRTPQASASGAAASLPAHAKAASARSVHQRTTKPKTLMRTSVKKPTASKIHSLNSTLQTESSLHAPTLVPISQHTSVTHPIQVTKSKLISRFHTSEPSPVTKKHSGQLAVRPEPAITDSPVYAPPKTPLSAANQMFETAMHKADSHRQSALPPSKHHKLGVGHKIRNLGALTAASVLIIGFIVIHNTPNFSMKLASNRADVQGSLPAYHLSGFSMQSPAYKKGEIVLNFHSNNRDNRDFSVTQKNATWSSQDLEQQFFQTQDSSYQRFDQNGKTIYIYGDNDATWVKNGVWYTLNGGAQLTTDQVLKFAASF